MLTGQQALQISGENIRLVAADNITAAGPVYVNALAGMVLIDARGGLTFGKDCAVTSGCHILSCSHKADPDDPIPFCRQEMVNEEIVFGNNVWLGYNCIVLLGVKVGSNVVVAAGSVLAGRHRYPSNCMIAGNPAKIIKVFNVSALRTVP